MPQTSLAPTMSAVSYPPTINTLAPVTASPSAWPSVFPTSGSQVEVVRNQPSFVQITPTLPDAHPAIPSQEDQLADEPVDRNNLSLSHTLDNELEAQLEASRESQNPSKAGPIAAVCVLGAGLLATLTGWVAIERRRRRQEAGSPPYWPSPGPSTSTISSRLKSLGGRSSSSSGSVVAESTLKAGDDTARDFTHSNSMSEIHSSPDHSPV